MTTLQVALALLAEHALARARRDRLGHVQQPEHRRDDGHGAGPAGAGSRRGARMMLQNTGAVISIAFVLAIITAAVPEGRPASRSSPASRAGLSDARLEPFIANMHTALWVLAATSRRRRRGLPAAPGARPRRRPRPRDRASPLRIGEVAEQAGTTLRTIRYYEEVGLLPGAAEREPRRAPHLLRRRRRAPARDAPAQGAARPLARRAARPGRGRGARARGDARALPQRDRRRRARASARRRPRITSTASSRSCATGGPR